MNRGLCKYCGLEKELCGAHIIPRAFYDKKHKYLGLTAEGDIDAVHAQNGLKDYNILCKECDNILGKYDNYAATILKRKIVGHPLIPEDKKKNEQIYVLTKEDFNYELLRKFFISLVWRASISNLVNVSLGKYEEIALQILKGEVPDNPDLFHPIIFRIPENAIYRNLFYFCKGKFDIQKKIVCSFQNYQMSIITNKKTLKKYRILDMVSLNQNEFSIIETNQDVHNSVVALEAVMNKIRDKRGGILPNFG